MHTYSSTPPESGRGAHFRVYARCGLSLAVAGMSPHTYTCRSRPYGWVLGDFQGVGALCKGGLSHLSLCPPRHRRVVFGWHR